MEYSVAGQALRSRIAFSSREPLRNDHRHRVSGLLLSDAEVVIELATRIGDIDDAGELADIDQAMAEEYPPAFTSDISWGEAVKRHFRQLDQHEKEAPKLLSFILGTIPKAQKDMLKAHPGFIVFERNLDYLAIWQLCENVFARQGQYSAVAARTKLLNLSQKKDQSFDSFVHEFMETIRVLEALGIESSE